MKKTERGECGNAVYAMWRKTKISTIVCKIESRMCRADRIVITDSDSCHGRNVGLKRNKVQKGSGQSGLRAVADSFIIGPIDAKTWSDVR